MMAATKKEKSVSAKELKNYGSCFNTKNLINYFIENKLYILIPLVLYGVLCGLTLLATLSTMSGVKYEKICLSDSCLANFKKSFGNVVDFHITGAEYIMWLTTIISLIVAIYSYVVSVKVSLTSLNNSEFQDFKNLLDHCIRADGDLKNYHINYHTFYKSIYDNSNEGDFSISSNYLEKLKKINLLIKSYNTDKASRFHDDYASSVISIFQSLGFNIKNRGRRYFHSDELLIVKFINDVNKSILKENKFNLIERALR